VMQQSWLQLASPQRMLKHRHDQLSLQYHLHRPPNDTVREQV
jgi:hypothetical protein